MLPMQMPDQLLDDAVQVALSGALAQRASQQQLFPAAINAAVAGLNDPELTTSSDVCAALQALAEACCRSDFAAAQFASSIRLLAHSASSMPPKHHTNVQR
jgi:predicted component of type VI protein secretion system